MTRRKLLAFAAPIAALLIPAKTFALNRGEPVPTLHPIIFDRNAAPVTIANSTAEQTLYSFTAMPGVMSTDEALILTANISGVDPASVATYTLRFKFAGVTIITSAGNFMSPTPGNAHTWEIASIYRDVASQIHIQGIAGHTVAFTTADLTAPIDIVITAQMTAASPGIQVRRDYVQIERR